MIQLDRYEELYQIHAQMCRVFAHPKRLEILDVLREGEMSVGELAARLGLAMANLSQHLVLMRDRGILLSRRQGNAIYYRVADPQLLEACELLRQVLFRRIRREEALVRRAQN